MSEVAAKRTPVADADLIPALLAAYARELGHEPKHETLAVICGQIALETAHGAAVVCWNLGNYKRGPGPDWCSFETTEWLGTPPTPRKIVCAFSAWPDLASATDFFIPALYGHWPEAWHAAVAGDPVAFAAGLRLRGYYTAPVEQYAAGVKRWFDFYLALLGGVSVPEEPALPSPGDLGALGILGLDVSAYQESA